MLTELRMELKVPDGVTIGMLQSSNFQGILMEKIDSEYADVLHQSELHPYSQCILNEGKCIWSVKSLNLEAYEKIIKPLLDDSFQEFDIRKKNIHIKIIKKTLTQEPIKSLTNFFYEGECQRRIEVEILTPMAFKRNGRYVIMPEMDLIYRSLMKKYSAVLGNMDMFDNETLEELMAKSNIVRYQLRSVWFPLEGVKIPSFVGKMTIQVDGTETLAKYAKMLFQFGEYSGIGIKSGIGMGAIKLIEREEKNERAAN